MNKLLIGMLIVLVVGIGSFFLLSNSPSNVTGNVVAEGSKNTEMKTFVFTGENFKFVMGGVDNPEIRVKQGDKVRIEFTSTSGFHDWKIDEFDAATERVNTGGSSSVEFIADEKGTFQYYCSVGQHRVMGMKGLFVVE